MPMLVSLPDEWRAMLSQFARFVLAGAVVAALGVGVYAIVALVLRWNPQLANLLSYLVAVVTGYALHSQWSFRGHSGRRTHVMKIRFLCVSLVSYALNSFWVWLVYAQFNLGRAAPILPMVFVTPGVTFLLNRQWVFRSAAN